MSNSCLKLFELYAIFCNTWELPLYLGRFWILFKAFRKRIMEDQMFAQNNIVYGRRNNFFSQLISEFYIFALPRKKVEGTDFDPKNVQRTLILTYFKIDKCLKLSNFQIYLHIN